MQPTLPTKRQGILLVPRAATDSDDARGQWPKAKG
jgi:hypothetical protein